MVVLGAGAGGLVAARRLRKRLNRSHRVVLIDRRDEFLFPPSFPWLMVGLRKPERVRRPLPSMLERGVGFVRGEVVSIDLAGKRVATAEREVPYDYLVIALGADLAPGALPGFSETALNFYDAEGAASIFPAMEAMTSGNIVLLVSSLPYKCPAAPYEAALLVHALLQRRGQRNRVNVAVYTPEPQPMPVAGPVVGEAVRSLLQERGIELHFNTPVHGIDPASRSLLIEGQPSPKFDLLLGVPPHRSPEVVRGSSLANPAGWISVDPATLETSSPGVFALGDVTQITLPNGKPLPKAGVFAHAQATVVADTIAARIDGGSGRRFDGVGFCFVEIGGGRSGFATGNFYATPEPVVSLRAPGRRWHWGRELLERYWMAQGLTQWTARSLLLLGSKLLKVPAEL